MEETRNELLVPWKLELSTAATGFLILRIWRLLGRHYLTPYATKSVSLQIALRSITLCEIVAIKWRYTSTKLYDYLCLSIFSKRCFSKFPLYWRVEIKCKWKWTNVVISNVTLFESNIVNKFPLLIIYLIM